MVNDKWQILQKHYSYEMNLAFNNTENKNAPLVNTELCAWTKKMDILYDQTINSFLN